MIARPTADAPTIAVSDIRRSLALIHAPGEVFEVRALDVPGSGSYRYTASGYFGDLDAAARAVAKLAKKGAAGIYHTINPALPDLLARANNRMVDRPAHTTTDDEIVTRRWLYLDIDSERPAGIAATEEELQAAFSLAADSDDLLRARGWPTPVMVDSGNGYARLYRIDAPNTPEATATIRQAYATLAAKLEHDGAHLDVGVFNAARITRVGGTPNRKGDATEGRPHRLCVYHDPDPEYPVGVVPWKLVESLAAEAPAGANGTIRPGAVPRGSAASSNGRHRLDVPRYLTAHGIDYRTKDGHGCTHYLVACPFDDSHGAKGESAITQRDDGLVTFECKHDSCNHNWSDYRAMVGAPAPDHYYPPLGAATTATTAASSHRASFASANGSSLPPGTRVRAGDRGNIGQVVEDCGATVRVHFTSRDGVQAVKELLRSEVTPLDGGQPIDIDIIPALSMLREYPHLRKAVIRGLARQGETINIIAASKVGKSWLSYSLAFAVALGLRWIGFLCEQGRVLIVDNELHKETITHRLSTVAEALGVSDAWTEQIDVLSLRGQSVDIHTLAGILATVEAGRYGLVIADAFYRFIPAGTSENDNAQIMAMYNRIDGIAANLGSVWVNIHHSSKGDQSGKSITDVGSGAGSQSRAADAHLVLRPHEDEDCAVLEAAVRSFAPVDPRVIRWEYPLWTVDEAADPKRLARPVSKLEERRQLKDDEDKQAIQDYLTSNGRATRKKLREMLGTTPDRIGRLMAKLVGDSVVIEHQVKVRGQDTSEYEIIPNFG